MVRQVDPWIVVPMHYKQEGMDEKLAASLGPVDDFLKEMGRSDIQPLPKLVVSTDKLPSELQIVVLERR